MSPLTCQRPTNSCSLKLTLEKGFGIAKLSSRMMLRVRFPGEQYLWVHIDVDTFFQPPPLYHNLTKRRWLSWKGWGSLRFIVRRRCLQQEIVVLRPRWSGFSLIRKTLVSCLYIPHAGDSTIPFHPDIDSPIQASASGSAGSEPDAGQVAMLADMGFTNAQARKALRETVSPQSLFISIYVL